MRARREKLRYNVPMEHVLRINIEEQSLPHPVGDIFRFNGEIGKGLRAVPM